MIKTIDFDIRKNKFLLTTVGSLLLHLFLLTIHVELSQKPSKMKSKEMIQVDLVNADEVLKRMRKAGKAKKTITLPRQIVNNDLVGKEEKPENSRFLGEKNQVVDRQTIASKVDTFNRAGLGKKSGDKDGRSLDKNKKKSVAKKKGKKAAKKMSLSDLGVGAAVIPAAVEEEVLDLESTQLGIAKGDANSRGLSSNNDYIEEIPLGDVTKLNTTEYKYYGFYHRIRQKLEQYWGRSLQDKTQKIFQSGRTLASNDNHITSLQIHINAAGEIIHVNIQGTSGIKELDDAAVESFNQAGHNL
jgi:protein TonB